LCRRTQNEIFHGPGTIAIVAATSNIFGGFLITDRMLKMFKTQRAQKIMISEAAALPIMEVTYLIASALSFCR